MKEIMRERDVEQALRQQVEKKGGLCLKFISPGWSGAPDRLCLFPGGKMCFVEVKRPGEKPRPLQAARHMVLKRLGFDVVVLDDTKGISQFLEDITSGGDDPAKDGGGAGVKP